MTLSSEQFHTLYDGAAQPVVLVQDGAVAELNCHAQAFFTAGTALCAYLPKDAALPETLYERPTVLPVLAGGVCVSANTQPLDGALLLFLPPQDARVGSCTPIITIGARIAYCRRTRASAAAHCPTANSFQKTKFVCRGRFN